ncbi:hypothetical protein ACJMK2_022750 [Sinanodonta woodiana]|uniref:Uncharacterized protein n=1 Tax=Sinanodonta woodiana TaxID=1069815 RepID=A0ABD3TM49_SINWO
MRTLTLCFLCGLIIAIVVETVMADFSRRNCFVECMVQKYRKPVYCECSNTDRLEWGKRTPDGYRTRSPARLPFRYGKRDLPFSSQERINDSGLDFLRNIQSIGRYELEE